MKRYYLSILGILTLSGCTLLAYNNFDKIFGPSLIRNRVVEKITTDEVDYWQEVKPILDNRCVVCHSCYDAPCQLKLTAIEGIERGANKSKVYNNSRLVPAHLTRLFEDKKTTSGWRKMGFFPVLNEHEQTVVANQSAGIMYQLLDLKEQHPLPPEKILSDEFELGIDREQVCTAPIELDSYKSNHPLWGMPYALPNLDGKNQTILKKWLEQGARYTARTVLPTEFDEQILKWETFLNQDSLKARLVSRYIFEHLFLGHLYFEGISDRVFFNLVRSSTPPGQPIDRISTRRPFDDPGVERVYYRLAVEAETIVAKSHILYALNKKRMERWQQLFFDVTYEVPQLSGYGTKVASNPFESFQYLPMESRYRFMLDDAQFFIMGFIKGSVCRGQIALDVIDDHFWVFFMEPDLDINADISEKLVLDKDDFALISAEKSYTPLMTLMTWKKYVGKERRLRSARDDVLLKYFKSNNALDLSLVWDGDGHNDNVALTIFRHFNSATVEKGLIGDFPKTAWIVGYPLIERIHYLIVAGYDVYGNLGHQLLSRLQMDFLRMEGETIFLMLLPREAREKERQFWYRGASQEIIDYLRNPKFEKQIDTAITYTTTNQKIELYRMLIDHVGSAISTRRDIVGLGDSVVQEQLQRLAGFKGSSTQLLPEVSFIQIVGEKNSTPLYVTLIRNTAHLNITSLFRESNEIITAENTVTLTKGLVGTYPNVFMKVRQGQIKQFVAQILAIKTQGDFSKLLDVFGVRRTSPNFWEYSDQIHQALYLDNPIEYGLLDYNRLENQ